MTLAAGSHVNDGGDAQAVSFGYTRWRAVTLLVNVERNHIPSQVRRYADGYSASRGGTLTFISGEFRYAVAHASRMSPFVFGGAGGGVSHPNVNDVFPDRVTNVAQVLYGGGGVLFALRPALAVCVDAKFMIVAERGEAGAMLPIRAGVTWRF